MKYLTLISLLLPINAFAVNVNCLVKAMIKAESSGDPEAINITHIGVSYGLMQIQLSTAQDMGFRGTLAELFKPAVNKKYGTRYIKYLLRRYHDQVYLSLDAYNRGMQKAEDYPYKGDWKNHPYVGKIIGFMEEICPVKVQLSAN